MDMPAHAAGPTPIHSCKSGSGATCTGENCCADANFCYSVCPIHGG